MVDCLLFNCQFTNSGFLKGSALVVLVDVLAARLSLLMAYL